ncbi:MAG: alpha/beta hydrolase [Gemmataceae bacterium]|nr:alpha/beta hydrolase [Gemmataceae bacterium]
MTRTTPDRLFRRANGRLLAYNEYGDPAGWPLLFFHSYPGSRLEGEIFDAAARQRGVRVLALDRPGYGLSDYERWRFTTWPDVVADFADGLGLDRFGVAGLAGGGPCAAACAWKLGESVQAAALVSSMAPLGFDNSAEGMNQLNAALYRLARRLPLVAGVPNRLARFLTRRFPRTSLAQLIKGAPAPDRVILERPAVRRLLLRDAREAFRQGVRGANRDLALSARPWGFHLAEIRTPVDLWQGMDDQNVPPAMGRHLARAIPGCRARFLPGVGHFWVVDHAGEVLDALLAAARPAPRLVASG